MPLTPEDVSNKRFTPVRLREGYDMGEVDQFLDEVEAELERLLAENKDLRTKLAAAQGGNGGAAFAMPAGKVEAQAAPAEAVAESPVESPAETAAQETEPAEAPEAPGKVEEFTPAFPTAVPAEQAKVISPTEASSSALRLLELATRNADEFLAEAKQEATQIVTTARTEAERLEAETKARAEKLEADARNRAQNLDAETEAKRSEMLGDIEREKTRLDGEVENLRAFEREYRSRLKSYFTQQLQALDGNGEGGDLSHHENGGAPAEQGGEQHQHEHQG